MADPNDLGLNLYDIYSPDQAVSQNAAAALARALRGRQALGMVGAASGDPAITQSAQGMLQQGNALQGELAGAGQHKAQQDLMRQQHAIEMARLEQQMQWQAGLLATKQEQADTARRLADLKAGEQMVTKDMWNNPITVMKYPDGHVAPVNDQGPSAPPSTPGTLLPNSVGTPGGGTAPTAPRPPRTGTPSSGLPPQLESVIQGVMNGTVPPDLKGLNRNVASAVTAELANRGFDRSKALNEWTANQKLISTMNDQQQMSQRQSLEGVPKQLDMIEGYFNQWQQMAPQFGLRVLNRAALNAAKQMGGQMGAVAQALDGQIADLTSELGGVYGKGNTPTDHALQLASKNLSGEWDVPTFKTAVQNIRRGIAIRTNALNSAQAVGVAGNRYGAKPAEAGAGAGKPNDPLGIR